MSKDITKFSICGIGIIVVIVVISVLGINWYADQLPVKASEYGWIDLLIKQCPSLNSEVIKDLQKGYLTNNEDRKLWDKWSECQIVKDEQKKNEIIKKYQKVN